MTRNREAGRHESGDLRSRDTREEQLRRHRRGLRVGALGLGRAVHSCLLRHETEGHPMKRAVTFLLAAGLVCALAAPVAAAPPSSDVQTDAQDAAAWIANQVTAAGFIPQAANP